MTNLYCIVHHKKLQISFVVVWQVDDDDDSSEEEETKEKRDRKSNGAYVPPKLVAMQYGKFSYWQKCIKFKSY